MSFNAFKHAHHIIYIYLANMQAQISRQANFLSRTASRDAAQIGAWENHGPRCPHNGTIRMSFQTLRQKLHVIISRLNMFAQP
jgi:hypothetical protein